MATTEKIHAIAQYLKQRLAGGEKLIVVLSAMGKTTDNLLAQAHELSTDPDHREIDQLLAVGEQTTIALMAIALLQIGVKARSFTGAQASIFTTAIYNKSQIEYIDPTPLLTFFETMDVAVIAGFQGMNAIGDVTTLGRGGSDTTAVALAAAFNTEAEIYTDVDGVYRTDPRVYPAAQKIDQISYEEMMEMSALGAKVMEMRSVELGKKYHVPIYVGKTLSEQNGTWIMEAKQPMEKRTVSAVTLNENILSVSIQNIPEAFQGIVHIFQIIREHHINIDMIALHDAENTNGLTFTIPLAERATFEKALFVLKEHYPAISLDIVEEYAKVSVVGLGMRDTAGVTAEILAIFSHLQIPFYQINTSEISLSFTTLKSRAKEVVTTICEYYHL